MKARQNQKMLSIILLASLLSTPTLHAQSKKQPNNKTENSTIHIRIEKEENGQKKVIERTYYENDLIQSKDSNTISFLMDSLELPDIDILTELDKVGSNDLRNEIPHFMQGVLHENHWKLRANADRLQEIHPAPMPPDIDLHAQHFPEMPFPPFELSKRFLQPLMPGRLPMEFDDEHYDIKEQKTEKGRSFIITPKPKKAIDRSDRSASLKIVQITPSSDRGVFDVQFYLAQKGDVTLVVRNTDGKEVVKEKIKNAEGEYTKSIDLGKRPKGVYFITVTQNNDGVVKRIVVE